jgi:hypothetical protein
MHNHNPYNFFTRSKLKGGDDNPMSAEKFGLEFVRRGSEGGKNPALGFN